MPDIHLFSSIAQPVSSLTHLLGAGLFSILGLFLLRRGSGRPGRLAALAVYTLSCILLLSLSGIYHLLPFDTVPRSIFGRLDHAAIFVLIAGTYTPVLGILFTGVERWGLLVIIWAAAVAGVVFKTVYFAEFPESAGLVFYLAMGWTGIVPGVLIWRRYGIRYLMPLVWGGVAYSAGAVMEFVRWPVVIPDLIGPHEVFHVAVLIGIACHWYFVARLAADGPPAVQPRTAKT
jgi:channel protein (hemolysin III family)